MAVSDHERAGKAVELLVAALRKVMWDSGTTCSGKCWGRPSGVC